MLTDDVLLEIFDFYQSNHDYSLCIVWEWHLLAHVCRRWRQIIFDSPNRLNVRILCTPKTPVSKNLRIWPAFPLAIDYNHNDSGTQGNVVAAIRQIDRVSYVKLNVTGSQLEKVASEMLQPFPVLTHLYIDSKRRLTFTANFLGGSAPCLRELVLSGVNYPALPTLLLSASGLVILKLHDIHPISYISPETMIACLAASPRLETLIIEFRSRFPLGLATPWLRQIRLPLVTQTVLPALTDFWYKGDCEYLEDLIPRIECPQLEDIFIDYLSQNDDFQVAQLSKFVDRSVGPFRRAYVSLLSKRVTFNLDRHANYNGWDRRVGVTISFTAIDWQSQIAQVLGQFSVALSKVVHLEFKRNLKLHVEEATDNVEWPRLFRQFPAMQMLHVCWDLSEYVALALEAVSHTPEMAAEVLPSLDLIYLEGRPASSIETFVAVRQLSGHPVTVVDTKTEFDQRVESYVSK